MAKATRCIRKTAAGKRCKSKATKGTKSCVSHKPKRRGAKKTKKKAKAKASASKTRCKGTVITTGKRCKCYCTGSSVYCTSHKKGRRKKSKKKVRKNSFFGDMFGGGKKAPSAPDSVWK